ncbi:substrate-binding periplasmic protein [Neptunomonas antarctica]|uniref:Amino acid ABC transporter substrate-binding protein, PAAT family n=1 Tax=Neptunomonas antarctica TaxID=619304 RepID=A0A1N7M3S5_9GAMM|nr:transporter substrate-binding domain-containing protein [Neptunomonas antarctica]SIS80734.1 amino acid ABC transporter substrate-binding protein, PAAT family [Neptunomonas antarctica]
MTVSKNKQPKNKKSKGDQMVRLLFLMVFLTGTSIAGMSHATTLKVCYDQWAPMTIFPSEESSARGVVIDMLDQIYTSKGYKLEYYEVPLARGLAMVAEGLCDMLPEYLFSKNAEKDFEYAREATFAYTTAFVVRRDDPWRYHGIQSIKGKRIATGPGWDYSSMSADYQKHIDDPKNARFVEVIAGYDDVVDRIFRMIKENRVDLYADNDLVLQHVLNRLNFNDDLRIVHPGLEKKLVEMPIFSKKIPDVKRQELIRIWNEGRLSMKGKTEKMILKKYNVTFEE